MQPKSVVRRPSSLAPWAGGVVLLGLVALVAVARDARAGDWTDKVKFSGSLQSDLRYTIDDWRGSPGQGRGWLMNRNDVDFRVKVEPAPRVQAVVQTRLRFYGFNKSATLDDLAERSKVDPFDLRLEEAYVAVNGGRYVDLKVGRLIQNWGSADMFNPTDNLNGRDFTDPLEYTYKVPNEMIELDFYPTSWLTLQAVFVPLFKPSMLPDSAPLGFEILYDKSGAVSSFPPVPLDRANADKLMGMFKNVPDSIKYNLNLIPRRNVLMPAADIRNSQAALRAKFRIQDFDFSLSYYYGRFSFPVALDAIADQSGKKVPIAASEMKAGKTNVAFQVDLMYPRMQVIGFDFSYSASWFFDVGIVGELAVIFPEKVTFGARIPDLADPSKSINLASLNVPSTPFVKATVGLDYTFTKWLYVNAMYVRGFFDEFNDRYGIHNYTVAAAELKFFQDELKIRLAGVINCDDRSMNVYPQITWVVAPSVELMGGVMMFIGSTKPKDPLDYGSKLKFGQKAAGRDFAFMKAKVTW